MDGTFLGARYSLGALADLQDHCQHPVWQLFRRPQEHAQILSNLGLHGAEMRFLPKVQGSGFWIGPGTLACHVSMTRHLALRFSNKSAGTNLFLIQGPKKAADR
jgi:hypothetical protein